MFVNILGFLDFLFLPQKMQYIFFTLTFIRIYRKCFSSILSFSSYSLGENKLEYFNKLLCFSIKSIKPVCIKPFVELYACIL